MKLFDYEVIYLAARGNPAEIIRLFLDWDFGGSSWILNPGVIVDAKRKYSDQVIAEYIGLCSLRPKNVNDLDKADIPPWVPWEVIQSNPLVKIDEDKIIFYKEK